ncbi:MAG: TerC family protein [Planctomycetaceae bacterium]
MADLFTVENAIALFTLSALEIVLGIDNIVFIAILAGKLPKDQQAGARRLGLIAAMLTRILLLLAIGWVMGLTKPLFYWPDWLSEVLPGESEGLSGRDLILLVGGLFLLGKATYEIHDKLEGEEPHGAGAAAASYAGIIVQIMLLDLVFSLDSVITAVGMVQTDVDKQWVGLTIMITAVVIAIGVMLIFAGSVSAFIEKHPTMKMLALSFLILIGVMLVVESAHVHVPKGYIYFAMAFSLGVELLNMRLRKVSKPVHLQQSYVETPPDQADAYGAASDQPPRRES